MRHALGTAMTGLVLGFVLSRIGFTSWDEVHRMFTFESFRMLMAFALGVFLLAVGWWLVRRLSPIPPRWSPRPIHKGTAVGGVVFGVGWALSGACPSIALVQLGEGQWAALFTIAGMIAGNWLYSVVHERYFRWTAGSCLDE